MIWHVLEIFLLLLVAFAVGCVLGTVLYRVLARTPLAEGQEALAAVVGGSVDRVKHRFGLAPAWRPRARRPRYAGPDDDHHAGYQADPGAERWEERSYADRRRPEPARTFDIEEAVLGDEPGRAGDREPETWDADWPDQPPSETEYEPAEAAEIDLPAEHDAELEPEAASAPEPEPAPVEPAPEPVPEPEPEPALPSMRPMGLSAPRNGVPDDLQRIRGIGKKNEQLLNGLGIFHISQIAAWTPAESRWVAGQMAFPERVERDDWIGQATILASGGSTDYVKASARTAPEAPEEPPPPEHDEEDDR